MSFEITQENVLNDNRRQKTELWETVTFKRNLKKRLRSNGQIKRTRNRVSQNPGRLEFQGDNS